MVKLRPRPGQILVEGLIMSWAPSPGLFHHWVPQGSSLCVLARWGIRQAREGLEACRAPCPPFPGSAPMPRGRAEAGAQWAGRGGHQPGPAGPGAAAGTANQWQRPALLRPLLRRDPEGPAGEEEGQPIAGAPPDAPTLLPSLKSPPVTTVSGLALFWNQEPESAGALDPTAERGHKSVKALETLQFPPPGAWDLALASFRA